jgi:hypothetical protein
MQVAVKRLRRFLQAPLARQCLLVEAALQLSLAWLMVRLLPFRWWSPRLGDSSAGEQLPPEGVDDPRAHEISRAVSAINRAVGGRHTCLMLAVAGQRMLNRRRISSSLVLGTFTEHGEAQGPTMTAHAWLRVGRQVILGGHDGRYLPLASFVRRYRRQDPE